ncbi:sulfhydrogenase subunit delta [Desulfovibrionales bacterium]
MAAKPRIAFFDFAGCEGDQLQIANLEEAIFDLFSHVIVVAFREVMTGDTPPYDIAFVEGSITRASDETRLKEIRRQSKLLVALGACATIGGINCLKNFQNEAIYRGVVYDDTAHWYPTYAARPITAVVPVDIEIHGCPIDQSEFVRITKELLLGKTPYIPRHPVCIECKQVGNICRYDLGQPCLGIITRAGCGACCVSEGALCWGCRGLVPWANIDAARYVMEERAGIPHSDVQDLMRFFLGYTRVPL